MKHIPYILYIVLTAGMLLSCGQKKYDVPASYEETKTQANIYPDYKDIVIPENIAPLNFMIEGAEHIQAVFTM